MAPVAPIPRVTEDQIRARVGETSFERGEEYFRSGAIFDMRRQGMTLKARCTGSQGGAYFLHVTFDANGIAEADCSCPVGSGGYCKHTAALLLTWQALPEDFIAVEELDAVLERRDKAELIALVKQMLRKEPELESLLEVPLPVSGKRASRVDPQVYRRQAASIFQAAEYEWGMEANVASGLHSIIAIGDGFRETGDFASAAAVYESVAAEVLEHYESFSDEEGELASVVQDCVVGLGVCLANEKDRAARERLLRALFDVYRFDVASGGVGLGEEAPGLILDNATDDERHAVAGWVREVIPAPGANWSANWRREAYGGFLLDLELDDLDDEAFLRICRETGRLGDLVDRLLTLGRLDEAVQDAQGANDYVLLQVADIFVRHDHADVAERLMRERAEKTQDTRVSEWLKNHYKRQGRIGPALELAWTLFRAHPGLTGYQEVRELARQLDRWDAIRPELLQLLQEEERWRQLLVQIYLDEGEIDKALEELRAVRVQPAGYNFYSFSSLALQVARAAEESRPLAAIEIYGRQAERLIDQRGRDKYREAAGLLKRVKALYERLDESGTWSGYIADLRDRYRALRALKEELTAAGL